MDGARVIGVRTGDRGIGKHGEQKPTFEPGVDIHAKVTIFCDGVRGNLTKELLRRLPLGAGRQPRAVRDRPQGAVGGPARPHRAGHRHAHARLPAAPRGVRRRLHLCAAGRPGLARVRRRASTTRIRCSTRTWRSTGSSSTRSWRGCSRAATMVRYGAKALPEGGWNTIPQPYMDGGADRRRRRRVPELDAPQGHSSRDAHRHAGGRDRRSRRSAPAIRRRRACSATRTRSTPAPVRAELYPVRNVHQAFGYGLFAGPAVLPGLALLTRRPVGRGSARPCRATSGWRRSAGTTARDDGRSAPSNATAVDRRAHVRQGDQRALFGHGARRGSAVAPARPHRGVQHRSAARVRPPVHAVLSRPTSTRSCARPTARRGCRSTPRTACTARRATSWIPTR